jgi:hypothetical protein
VTLLHRAKPLLKSEGDVPADIVVGADPRKHLDAIARLAAAGFTEVYVHQIGPDQAGFMDFYQREVLPSIATGG